MVDKKEQEKQLTSQEKLVLDERKGEVVFEKKEQSPEVESVIEKLERKVKADQQKGDVQDDVAGATVVTTGDDQPAVTLPVTQDDMVQGKKMSVWESLRWLVEWVQRQMKKLPGRVRYQEPSQEG